MAAYRIKKAGDVLRLIDDIDTAASGYYVLLNAHGDTVTLCRLGEDVETGDITRSEVIVQVKIADLCLFQPAGLSVNLGGENSLYILDEPVAALSPARQMTLLARMHQLIQQGCQFIIATHSPILMAYPGALIYELSGKGLHPICYQETEHYAVTKEFLNKTDEMLAILLGF